MIGLDLYVRRPEVCCGVFEVPPTTIVALRHGTHVAQLLPVSVCSDRRF